MYENESFEVAAREKAYFLILTHYFKEQRIGWKD